MTDAFICDAIRTAFGRGLMTLSMAAPIKLVKTIVTWHECVRCWQACRRSSLALQLTGYAVPGWMLLAWLLGRLNLGKHR